MLADAEDRITINRRAGELTISFSGDTNQAGQFARSVPDFVLKGRFANQVKVDLHALEQEMGFAVERVVAAHPQALIIGGGSVTKEQIILAVVPNHSPSMVGSVDKRRNSTIRRQSCPPTDMAHARETMPARRLR